MYKRGVSCVYLSSAEEALRHLPYSHHTENHAGASYFKGIVLSRLGRQEEAIEAFMHTLSVDSGCASAAYQIGLSYASLGRLAEAVSAYDRALQIRPTIRKRYITRVLRSPNWETAKMQSRNLTRH